MRIADVQTGVRLMRRAGGNLMRNLHPLYTNPGNQYDGGVGFRDDTWNNNYCCCCHADHFSTGFLFGKTAGNTVMESCIAFWYAPSKGKRHTAVMCEGKLLAQVDNMHIVFRGTEAVNTVLEIGESGGNGYIRDPRIDQNLLRKDDTVFRSCLQGVIH